MREVADSGEAKNWGSKAKTGEQIGEQILFFCYLMPL